MEKDEQPLKAKRAAAAKTAMAPLYSVCVQVFDANVKQYLKQQEAKPTQDPLHPTVPGGPVLIY